MPIDPALLQSFLPAVVLFLVLVGAYLLLAGIRLALDGEILRAASRFGLGLVLAVVGIAVSLITGSVLSYSRLTFERPIVQLSIRALTAGDRQYEVTIQPLAGDAAEIVCYLHGDEWTLSARVQKWHPWLNVLGFNSTYLLDQLANKYISAEEAADKFITACDLSGSLLHSRWKLPDSWARWVTSVLQIEQRRFGSATYMPLADGAAYIVFITQNGLNSEPLNRAARIANSDREN